MPLGAADVVDAADFLAGGRVPLPQGSISASREERFAVRRPGHADNRILLTEKPKHFLAGSHVPHRKELIPASGEYPAAVRRDSECVDGSVRSAKSTKDTRGGCLDDQDVAVIAAGQNYLQIRRKGNRH